MHLIYDVKFNNNCKKKSCLWRKEPYQNFVKNALFWIFDSSEHRDYDILFYFLEIISFLKMHKMIKKSEKCQKVHFLTVFHSDSQCSAVFYFFNGNLTLVILSIKTTEKYPKWSFMCHILSANWKLKVARFSLQTKSLLFFFFWMTFFPPLSQ